MARLGHASTAAAIRYQHELEGQDTKIADYLEGVGRSAPPGQLSAGQGASRLHSLITTSVTSKP